MVTDRRADISPCLADAQADNCCDKQRDKEKAAIEFHIIRR